MERCLFWGAARAIPELLCWPPVGRCAPEPDWSMWECPERSIPLWLSSAREAMAFPLPEEYDKLLEKARSCDVAVIGPGLGRHPQMERLVRSLLCDLEIPVVLDADGINALSGHIDSLDRRRRPRS